MSANLIGNFTRRDVLDVRVKLGALGGVPEPLAGSTIELILVKQGETVAAKNITRVVPASADADLGIYLLQATAVETDVPAGRYMAYVRRTKVSGARFTFHRESLVVYEAAP